MTKKKKIDDNKVGTIICEIRCVLRSFSKFMVKIKLASIPVGCLIKCLMPSLLLIISGVLRSYDHCLCFKSWSPLNSHSPVSCCEPKTNFGIQILYMVYTLYYLNQLSTFNNQDMLLQISRYSTKL